MKKRGFTLIELLAVIVILAIIALIATPAVLNIIEDSRKSAAEASARNIMNAAKTYYMSEIMNGRTVGSIDLSTNTLKYDGDQAVKGSIIFTDRKTSGKMYINGYCVEISTDGTISSEKKPEDECEITISENSSLGCDTLYWDGNINGLEKIDLGDIYYLISNVTPSFEDLSNGISGSEYYNGTITNYDISNDIRYHEGEYMLLFEGCIAIFFEENTFGIKPGTYFVRTENEDTYIHSLTINNYKGFPHTEYCSH